MSKPGISALEPVTPLGLAGSALVLEQLGAVLGRLEDLGAPPAARVPRDLRGAVDEAHRGVAGDERQRLVGMLRRDGVAVGVEARKGRLVDGDRLHEVRLGERIGQRQQAPLLFEEHLVDAPLGPSRMGTHVGDGGEEDEKLGVALVEIANRARGEEAFAQVADRALDLALLLGLSDAAEPRCHAELPAKREQLGVEAHRISVALEHDDLRIVEEPLPGDAAEVDAGTHERAPERAKSPRTRSRSTRSFSMEIDGPPRRFGNRQNPEPQGDPHVHRTPNRPSTAPRPGAGRLQGRRRRDGEALLRRRLARRRQEQPHRRRHPVHRRLDRRARGACVPRGGVEALYDKRLRNGRPKADGALPRPRHRTAARHPGGLRLEPTHLDARASLPAGGARRAARGQRQHDGTGLGAHRRPARHAQARRPLPVEAGCTPGAARRDPRAGGGRQRGRARPLQRRS